MVTAARVGQGAGDRVLGSAAGVPTSARHSCEGLQRHSGQAGHIRSRSFGRLVHSVEGDLSSRSHLRQILHLLCVIDPIARQTGHLQRELGNDSSESTQKLQTTSLEAFHLYLKGRHHWNKRTGEALRKAISYFNQAIETDPSYALAHAGLADCYLPLGYWAFLSPQDAFPKAKAAAAKALQIDKTIADAYTVLGGVNMCFEWQWQQSEADLKRAIELNSNHPRAHQIYAELLTLKGDFDRAAGEARCAIELDPLAPAGYFAAGLAMYCARRYAQALTECEKALDIDPDFFPAHLVSGLVFEGEGRFDDAIESLEEAWKASGENALVRAVLSGTFAFAGRRDDARTVLRELEQGQTEKYVSPIPVAVTLAALGEYESAFARLEDGMRLRCPRAVWCKVDPRLMYCAPTHAMATCCVESGCPCK